ncbi:MAG: ATP-binding protein [Candidatus Tyrphobacter sp.]
MNAPIRIVDGAGTTLAMLSRSVSTVLEEASQRAVSAKCSRLQAIEDVLADDLRSLDILVPPLSLHRAVQQVDAATRAPRLAEITIESTSIAPKKEQSMPRVHENGKTQTSPIQFFGITRTYPHKPSAALYASLVGLDRHKEALLTELRLRFSPELLEQWSRKHHGAVLKIIQEHPQRVPLVILSGDVGCGKTALAETVGAEVVASGPYKHVHLLKLNTQVRGTGFVGQMTDLLVQAFSKALAEARRHPGEPTILLIDEADALASSRESDQMHHEDKAGLNTILQQLDGLRTSDARLVVLFITNRPDVLDPAIRRRCSLELTFARPTQTERKELFRQAVAELRLSPEQLDELAHLTGGAQSGTGYTSSDIIDRLLPGAVRSSYVANRPLTFEAIRDEICKTAPSPRFGTAD